MNSINRSILLIILVFQSLSLFSKNTTIYVGNNLDYLKLNKNEYIFPTINQAINQAYVIKASDKEASITICIGKGEYHLLKTIQIDSRLNDLTIKSMSDDNVVLKGSVPLKLKWKKYKDGIYVATVKEDVDFDQFVVNGKLQTLARYPNYDEKGGYWNGYASDAISPERISKWKNPKGAIFNAMHAGRWGSFHYIIDGVDKKGEAILKGGGQNNRPSKPHKEFRMVENVFEELDAPKEWYYNHENNKIYYMPSQGLDMSNINCEGVVLKSLIEIKGSIKNPVKNIHIEGIKFECTKRTIFEKYESLLRSDWCIYRGGAILLNNSESCTISNCEFENLGGNVIFVSGYNINHKISSNHIHDCGASAICFVGEPSAVRNPLFSISNKVYVDYDKMDKEWGPKTKDYPSDCTVEDNLIHRIGRIEKQTAGVEISMSMNITVRHNSIYDVPRAGINIGDGTWGGHLLEYNDVFNTVLETSDHGSFNSWGRDRFWHRDRNKMDSLVATNPTMPYWDAVYVNTIRNNRFRCDHGWDIDLDDGSSNYHIYNNLCLNGGIKLREGFRRVVENNVLINNSLNPHVWFAASQDIFRRNIVQDAYRDIRVSSWGRELNHNLFPNEESLMKAQACGIDANSSYGTPMFNNPKKMDFRVKADSPALALGFVNFSMNEFGVQNPKLKALAKTPKVPNLTKNNKISHTPIIKWSGASMKSVESIEEQSAYGLYDKEGIIILRVGSDTPVGNSGIKKGDIIISVGGKKITGLKSFFEIIKYNNNKEAISVGIIRNHKKEQKTIKLR